MPRLRVCEHVIPKDEDGNRDPPKSQKAMMLAIHMLVCREPAENIYGAIKGIIGDKDLTLVGEEPIDFFSERLRDVAEGRFTNARAILRKNNTLNGL